MSRNYQVMGPGLYLFNLNSKPVCFLSICSSPFNDLDGDSKTDFLFIYFFGCVGSSLLHTGFLYLQRAGATLCCGARASHCGGFSCCGAWALGMRASVVAACRP